MTAGKASVINHVRLGVNELLARGGNVLVGELRVTNLVLLRPPALPLILLYSRQWLGFGLQC